MSECKRGGPNCGKLDCAWGCAASDDPPVVPTAVVLRKRNSATPADGDSAAAAVRGQPPAAPQTTDPVAQTVEQWLETERKARVLDQLAALLERQHQHRATVPIDTLLRLVHPAH